jgi:hypothetical protein
LVVFFYEKVMKRFLLISFILAGTLGNYNGIAQGVPVYPIPSYNVLVDGNATFRESVHKPGFNKSKQKRVIHVSIKPKNGTQLCQATVWIYTLDQSAVLGPFTVNCGETLTVEIDDREWGVLVESEEEIITDVWITIGDSKAAASSKSEATTRPGSDDETASSKGEAVTRPGSDDKTANSKGEASPRPGSDDETANSKGEAAPRPGSDDETANSKGEASPRPGKYTN